MTSQWPASLVRLAHANPAPANARLGFAPQAQAQLARILAGERDAPARRWRPPRRRVIAVVVLAGVLAGCGAFRAADPFGFWRSSTPGTADFGVNPAQHVRAPAAAVIGCRQASSTTLACTPSGGSLRYRLISHASAAVPSWFSRARLLRTLATAVPKGETSATQARRLRADIAAVPDSFFVALRELGRFQTLESSTSGSAGTVLVPPHGVPLLIACWRRQAAIECHDLNGDEQTPVGAGIYGALPTAAWISVRSRPVGPINALGEQMMVAVLGHAFTKAEWRLLFDLARTISPVTTHGGGAVVRGHSAKTAAP